MGDKACRVHQQPPPLSVLLQLTNSVPIDNYDHKGELFIELRNIE